MLRSTKLVLALALSASAAQAQTTIASGVYSDPTIWDTGVVPTPDDVVTIGFGHTVGLSPLGVRPPRLELEGLIVNGTLLPNFPPGQAGRGLRIFTPYFENNGLVSGEDGIAGRGGTVTIGTIFGLLPGFPPAFGPFPGDFINNGIVRGGDGTTFGGSVRIDYRGGAATNAGLLEGGSADRGGVASMRTSLGVNSGVIQGGDSVQFRAGSAWMRGETFPPGAGATDVTNAAGGIIVGGSAAGAGSGGNAWITGFSLPFFPTSVLNEAGATVLGGNGCRAGDANVTGIAVVNFGEVGAGIAFGGQCEPRLRRIRLDPPTGTIGGASRLDAEAIELFAGSSLTLENFTTPGAVRATESLTITLAPGGTLDMSQTDPADFDVTGDVTVAADNVLLPAGLTLGNLFPNATVSVEPGAAVTAPFLHLPESSLAAALGETVELPVEMGLIGNVPEGGRVTITSLDGWWPEVEHVMSLEAMEIWGETIDVHVPQSAVVSHGTIEVAAYDAYDHLLEIDTVTVEIGSPECGLEEIGTGTSHLRYVFPAGHIAFGTVQHAAQPGMLSVIGLFGQASPPLPLGPNLELYVNLATAMLWFPVATDPWGLANVPLPLSIPGISGQTFHMQAVTVDPLQPGVYESSNALALTTCL